MFIFFFLVDFTFKLVDVTFYSFSLFFFVDSDASNDAYSRFEHLGWKVFYFETSLLILFDILYSFCHKIF